MRTIAIHGATGSIGRNAIDIVCTHPDRFTAKVLMGGANAQELAKLAKQTSAEHVAIADQTKYHELKNLLPDTHVYAGQSGIIEASSIEVDTCLAAITGSAGILPTYTALSHCKYLALANKESIVAAGEQIIAKAAACNVKLLPVDSEHSGLFQVFDEAQRKALRHVTITASGGPFRTLPKNQFHTITRDQALTHPNWSMGPKNTIDSATLMNKGLEYIEAALLFDLDPDQIKIIVHPQSIVHALSSYEDGTTLAHLGLPDMRTPIGYALAWPERIKTRVQDLDLSVASQLTFEQPDYDKFPCLKIAEHVVKSSQAARIIMNAADEVAFNKFMAGEIHFTDIPGTIQNYLETTQQPPISSIDDVISLDKMCR